MRTEDFFECLNYMHEWMSKLNGGIYAAPDLFSSACLGSRRNLWPLVTQICKSRFSSDCGEQCAEEKSCLGSKAPPRRGSYHGG